jgi:GT2 family glycosyltransferase
MPAPAERVSTAGMPVLSVVVCTHDRTSDVLECLRSLMPQLATGSTEVIVVDSASSAAERAALEAGLRLIPQARHVRLEQVGLALARNAGVAATASEWVAFVDDDAVPDQDWHAQLLQVLARVPADCGAIGGRILPRFPAGQSPQLSPRWKRYVSINDAGHEWDCTELSNLIGANCVFRRRALEQAGGFPLQLGRVGQSLLSGEEVVAIRRIRARGWRLRYHSQFSVAHKVSQERLTRRWARSRAYWEGITTVRMAKLEGDRGWLRLSLKSLCSAPIVGLLALLASRAEWDFRFCFNCGVLMEAVGLAPGVARQPRQRPVDGPVAAVRSNAAYGVQPFVE